VRSVDQKLSALVSTLSASMRPRETPLASPRHVERWKTTITTRYEKPSSADNVRRDFRNAPAPVPSIDDPSVWTTKELCPVIQTGVRAMN
jgi:hypothetical protein